MTSSKSRPQSSPDPVAATDQAASDLIRARLEGASPALIARLGGVELDVLFRHLAVKRDSTPLRRSSLILRRQSPAAWTEEGLERLVNNAGFFPNDATLAAPFAELMLDDMATIDVLGLVGTDREERARGFLRHSVEVRLRDLEPYYHPSPWTEALTGKKVLVVHPFAESIESQYARRELLFEDPRVLPEFELTVIPAVQSIAGTPTRFATWFDALDHMKEQMAETDFDVAIVGCGAYGLPLAAHAKRLGRKGVVLGGAVQILFGIKGRRWDEHEVISRLYNEHWVRPRESERPGNFAAVEDGCYW